MSEISNAVLGGLTLGLYNTANILTGGITSYGIYRTGADPFYSFYTNLDSPSGFSSAIHPSYATPYNVRANVNGLDTTWAPFTSALTTSASSIFGGGLWGGGLWGGGLWGGGLYSYGYPDFSNIHISASTHTHLGTIPRFNGYF